MSSACSARDCDTEPGVILPDAFRGPRAVVTRRDFLSSVGSRFNIDRAGESCTILLYVIKLRVQLFLLQK